MGKNLVIINGCPGSGKSYMARKVKEDFPFFSIFPYDSVKEEYFDSLGFDNIKERSEVEAKSLEEYYARLKKKMERGEDLIIEYPFCKKHEKTFNSFVEEYGYKACTITLYGDLSVLLSRWEERDKKEENRHPGHYLVRYHKGEEIKEEDYKKKPSLEEFTVLCKEKDYFLVVGETIRVDVTDFSKVNYKKVISLVNDMVSKN